MQKKSCLIISGGEFSSSLPEGSYDLVIAVDKGVEYAEKLRIRPDLLLGDFDSLEDSPALKEDLYPGRTGLGELELEIAEELDCRCENKDPQKTIRLYRRKDDTDTMAAARYALGAGCRHITLFCIMGGRFDHMLANLQTAAFIAAHDATAQLIGDNDEILAFQNNSLSFSKKEGWSFSVLALSDECTGVDISGALYSGKDLTLKNTTPLGLGNDWEEDIITVGVKKGILAVVMSKMP